MRTSDAVLDVEGLTVRYGPIEALSSVSLHVDRGEVVALLGSNGAGKSSLLRSISGVVPPAAGTVRLMGNDLTGRSPHRITRAGLAHVPEGRRVVAPLSVEQNLEIAGRGARRRSPPEMEDGLEEVYATFPRLRERRTQISGLLSGGEQQMLAIGRGIMAAPSVLLLDEPSMGLAPIVIEEIYDLLKRRSGTLAAVGILLAEQSAALALSVADRAIVLARGEVAFTGEARLLDEQTMLSAYLGHKSTEESGAVTGDSAHAPAQEQATRSHSEDGVR